MESHLDKDYLTERDNFLTEFKNKYNGEFLKIISNWYFLALRKTQKNAIELKTNRINDFEEFKKTLLNLYEKNLEISL